MGDLGGYGDGGAEGRSGENDVEEGSAETVESTTLPQEERDSASSGDGSVEEDSEKLEADGEESEESQNTDENDGSSEEKSDPEAAEPDESEPSTDDGDLVNPDIKLCPGKEVEVCVSVCPGTSARIYGACVQGCAERCPDGENPR